MKTKWRRPQFNPALLVARAFFCCVVVGGTSSKAQQVDQAPIAERITVLENRIADGVYRPAELGAHHRVWEKIPLPVEAEDSPVLPVNSYVELATGLNRWDEAEQKWVEADDEIEIFEDHAAAVKTAHKVRFNAGTDDPRGTIELTTLDGLLLRSRVVGLAYTDSASGKSVFIAETKPVAGVVVGRNQVIYADAFDDVKADIRYTTTRAGVEADVILREKIPPPAAFQMDPATTKLEAWTEFLESPNPDMIEERWIDGAGEDNADTRLKFGTLEMRRGKAFSLANEPGVDRPERNADAIPVSKEWHQLEGRRFLIETVPYSKAGPEIQLLPDSRRQANIDASRLNGVRGGNHRQLPQTLAGKQSSPRRPNAITLAKLGSVPAEPGYVLDWIGVTSASNFTFRGDMTYYVSGTVALSGTTVIEGGTVVKYAKSGAAEVGTSGPIQCKTGPYQPAFFTAIDDDTIGEVLPGSTGSPTGAYGSMALSISGTGGPHELNHIRIRHMDLGVVIWDGNLTVRHSQFFKCAISTYSENSSLKLQNVLVHQGTTSAIDGGGGSTIVGEHLTINQAGKVLRSWGASLTLTNSIIYAITDPTINYTHSSCAHPAAGSSVFLTVGGGFHYLVNNSVYRNAGSVNINPALKLDLIQKTTYPPVVYPINHILNADTVWSPVTARDFDAPDLGYHYEPIDYAVNYCFVGAGKRLTVHPGTVMAAYGVSGVRPMTGATVEFIGRADNRVILADFQTIQEGDGGWVATPKPNLLLPGGGLVTGITMDLRFSDFYGIARMQYGLHIKAAPNGAWDYNVHNLILRDSRTFNAYTLFGSVSGATHLVRNNLFHRGGILFWDAAQLDVYNNTFFAPWIQFIQTGSTTWTFKDNIFHSYTASTQTIPYLSHGYNGYINCGGSRIGTANGTDVIINAAVNYDTGLLGGFYLNSTGSLLVNAGSTTAATSGLYHHTTQTSQVKELNTQVDIGYHHVALDAWGGVQDTDWDGIPDYLEDSNGDGVTNGAESNWSIADGPIYQALGLVVFTPFK